MNKVKTCHRAGGILLGISTREVYSKKRRAHVRSLQVMKLFWNIPEMVIGTPMFLSGRLVIHVDFRAAVVEPYDGLLEFLREISLFDSVRLCKISIPIRV
jgi:hypothetical protein